MFYKNIQTNEVYEMVYSDKDVTIVIDQAQSLEAKVAKGKIIKEGKRVFKKSHKKLKDDSKLILIDSSDKGVKDQIIKQYKENKALIAKNKLIQENEQKEREEYFKNLSPQEHEEMLAALADD